MTTKKKAIFIYGCSFTNKGPEAMILTVADAIRQRFPGAEIFVRVPSLYFSEARANRLIPINKDQPTSAISHLMSKMRMIRVYYKTILVDVGGYQFGDPWGEDHARRRLKSVRLFSLLGNPVFFMPQTWGPFSTDSIGKAVRSIVDIAQVVYARDRASLTFLQQLAGAENPKVRFAHDVAWNFRGDELALGRRLIQETGLSMGENSITVCVIPNLRVYERCEGTGRDNKYIKVLCEVVRYLCSAHNARVILMGHELRRNNFDVPDDRILCNYILAALGKSMPVVHIDKWLPAGQVKSVIGNCDLAISSRYHGLIAALSQGVPSIAIGWAHKYEELFSEFGMSSNLLSLSKTNEETFEDIDAIIRQLPQQRKLVLANLDIMKKGARQAIDDILSRMEARLHE
jgi:colanic acid/amylovoran biosynthesis protein